MRMIAPSVTMAVTGAVLKLFQAEGARLRPMSATIVPVTTGGMTTSIQCTTTPTIISRTPVTRMPPTAADCPPWFTATPMGAMNANDEPR